MTQVNKARKPKKTVDGAVFEDVHPKHINQQVRNPKFKWSAERDKGPQTVYSAEERLTGPAAQHAKNLKWLRLAAKCPTGGFLNPQKLLFWVCNELRQKDFKRKKDSDRDTMRADARRRVWAVTDAEIAAAVDYALDHDPSFWCPFTVGHDICLSIEKWQAIGEPTIIRACSHYEMSEALIEDNKRAARQERNRRQNEGKHEPHEVYAERRYRDSYRAFCARNGLNEDSFRRARRTEKAKPGTLAKYLKRHRVEEKCPAGLDATYIEEKTTPRLKVADRSARKAAPAIPDDYYPELVTDRDDCLRTIAAMRLEQQRTAARCTHYPRLQVYRHRAHAR